MVGESEGVRGIFECASVQMWTLTHAHVMPRTSKEAMITSERSLSLSPHAPHRTPALRRHGLICYGLRRYAVHPRHLEVPACATITQPAPPARAPLYTARHDAFWSGDGRKTASRPPVRSGLRA